MLPDNTYARTTLNFAGAPAPRGAAVVWCWRRQDEEAIVSGDDASFADKFAGAFLPVVDSSLTLTTASTKVGPDATGPTYEASVNQIGGVGGGAAAPNVAWLFHKITDQGGHRGRGRMFLPGAYEGGILEDGTVSSEYQAALALAVSDFADALDAGLTPMSVWLEHFDETEWQLIGGKPRRVPVPDTAPDPSIILTVVPDSRVATQRRRLRG